MLRNSGEVLAEVEHRDVVLRRRDGEDLFLGLRSREASVRDVLGVLARLLLAASVDADTRRKVAGRAAAPLPWTTFLPDDEREEFFDALTSTAAACVEAVDAPAVPRPEHRHVVPPRRVPAGMIQRAESPVDSAMRSKSWS